MARKRDRPGAPELTTEIEAEPEIEIEIEAPTTPPPFDPGALIPVVSFVAPYGGRYAVGGFVHELRARSVVSAATHDMAAILLAKIELHPVS